jgi:hypothetical protein
VNGRVRPVDELAVHPDLRGLLHVGVSSDVESNADAWYRRRMRSSLRQIGDLGIR